MKRKRNLFVSYLSLAIALSGLAILTNNKFNIQESAINTTEVPEEGYSIYDLPALEYHIKSERKQKGDAKMDKPDQFMQYLSGIRREFGAESDAYPRNYQLTELMKSEKRGSLKSGASGFISWQQRGPANVGGRTRGIIYDPDDTTLKTWYAAAASGGVWKTSDEGQHWTNLTPDIPNLASSCIAMAPSDHDIIYVGTGEGYSDNNYSFVRGNGILQSTDRGINWEQLSSTVESKDFDYVNRIVVHPDDASIVIAATNTGIFRTTDGFSTFDSVFQVADSLQSAGTKPAKIQSLAASPDFTRLYAGIRGYGIAMSEDGGLTWELQDDLFLRGNRFEVSVSPADPDFVYVYTEDWANKAHLFISHDAGHFWKEFRDTEGRDLNFLLGQGWYDNTLTGHPYDPGKVFVGGVNVGMFDFESLFEKDIVGADTINTSSFMDLVRFGGEYFQGTISMLDHSSSGLEYSELVNVSVRFGPGRSQKAHRFIVPPESTSGVPEFWYYYMDYVDVPFEVWDTDNNRQLMVSFRDQENDTVYNLYERTGEGYGELGREYIYIHALPYDEMNPHHSIADTIGSGSQVYKQYIYFWPVYSGEGDWDPANAPESELRIEVDSARLFDGQTRIISDAYRSYTHTGKNSDLHPDHHALMVLPVKPEYKIFNLVSANDGGLAISKDEGSSWEPLHMGYITSQFYSATKKRGEDMFLGGTQDNGSYVSPFDEAAGPASEYLMTLGGDGFEVLWDYQNPDRMICGAYYNKFYRSLDGGKFWSPGFKGISDGPFISRISSSVSNPDALYAVSNDGVYKSSNFGESWKLVKIDRNWVKGVLNSEAMFSYHNVRVSLANDKVVWAGAALSPEESLNMFVSTDAGESYTEVQKYALRDMRTYATGIATHPHQDSTAYIMFSLPGNPKILRTEDLGETWEDLSGFGSDSVSDNGFPDVGILSLLVMPHNPEIIWAGTEIGIYESMDGGESWHKLDSDLPAVSVWQMTVVDDQVVLATFGRGIWSASIPELEYTPILFSMNRTAGDKLQISGEFDSPYDELEIYVNNELHHTITNPEQGENVTFTCPSPGYWEGLRVSTVAYMAGIAYKSNMLESIHALATSNRAVRLESGLRIYPNPSDGMLSVELDEPLANDAVYEVFNYNGQLLVSGRLEYEGRQELNLSHLENGIYVFSLRNGGKRHTENLIIRK